MPRTRQGLRNSLLQFLGEAQVWKPWGLFCPGDKSAERIVLLYVLKFFFGSVHNGEFLSTRITRIALLAVL